MRNIQADVILILPKNFYKLNDKRNNFLNNYNTYAYLTKRFKLNSMYLKSVLETIEDT